MKRAQLVGQLVDNPLIRFVRQHPIATFTLDVCEPSSESPSFAFSLPCVAWGAVAETVGQLRAAALVRVQGRLCWYSPRATTGQEQSTPVVHVRAVTVLAPAAVEVR